MKQSYESIRIYGTGTTEVNSVNSREVYEYLKVESNYSTWFNRAVEKYDFVDGEDYVSTITDSKSGKRDYIVTLDMAKELCMVSNTELYNHQRHSRVSPVSTNGLRMDATATQRK